MTKDKASREGAGDDRGGAGSGRSTGNTSDAQGSWASLSRYYDYLFPPGRPQLDFINGVAARMVHPGRRVLDVGCATGGYTLALADLGYEVTAVDLDAEMIRLARSKAEARAKKAPAGWKSPRFVVADMASLQDVPELAGSSFDLAICLGNTLAAMLSAAELGTALGEMAACLVPGARAVLQTINYDRLAADPVADPRLPPIVAKKAGPDGQDLLFKRHYLPRADGLISFVTCLHEIAGPGRTRPRRRAPLAGRTVLRAETLLRPIEREELETVARMAFHGPVEVYGDFLSSPWSPACAATVVVATRGADR